LPKYQDDKIIKLESDIDKIRKKFRMYISYSGSAAALSTFREMFANGIDECKNPRSPGNKIHIEFDEQTGFVSVEDNGRGIDTSLLEEIFTTINMGSNIDSSDKSDMKIDVLGTNGAGTVAICGLGEVTEIISYRGPSEGVCKTLVFEEGIKVSEETMKCSKEKHGLFVKYKPSQILGKGTKLIWNDIHSELLNFQYLNENKIKIDSLYIDKSGKQFSEVYKPMQFIDILDRNGKDDIISQKYYIPIESDDVVEEYDNGNVGRFIRMDIVFCFSSNVSSPYAISFSNSSNTIDFGDHFDACVEGLCRFLQTACKNSMSEKERDKLDIKWDDVKSGLSLAVSLHSNFEKLYTGQTKHKLTNEYLKKVFVNLFMEELEKYFTKNQSQLRELINIVKTNARARRESDKVKSVVIKGNLTKWSAYKIRNYDPCANTRLTDYKELYLIEGDRLCCVS